MKKTILTLLIVITLISLLPSITSCGRGQDEISMLYYTYSDAYISSVRSAADKALKNSGLKYHNYDATSNQTTQTEQVDTAITKGTSLLAVNIVDTGSDDAAKAIIEKARNAGIPLIFFNRSVSDEIVKSYDKCYFVGTDYEEAGHLQGQMIGEYVLENYSKIDINGDGKISYVLFKGQQGNSEAEARTKYAVLDCNKILEEAGKPALSFYDKQNSSGYLVDQDGNWSGGAANNYMKTVLSAYSERGGNMVELVIANNDEMALGALAALEEAGYNKDGGRYIPIFGVDATEAAKAKINSGAMTGTVNQDAKGMAEAIGKIALNIKEGRAALYGFEEDMKVGEQRINIPYSVYKQN